MSKSFAKPVLLLAAACILLSLSAYLYVLFEYAAEGWYRHAAPSRDEGPAEIAAKSAFLSTVDSAQERYDTLFRYFAAGAATYASPLGAHIHYRGVGGSNGYQISGLEGFARTGTLLAAWSAAGRGAVKVDGERLDQDDFLRRGILTGTDPASKEYWGDIHDRGQRIFEAADIARILWITRTQIWDGLTDGQRTQIADWLLQVKDVATHDNNMLLSPITTVLIMRALGRSVAFDETARYEQFKHHYLSDGWFEDDPGVLDYYNTWGITYELFWIALIEPALDRDFIRRAIAESARFTAHLIGPQGFPIMGRSICYRTAVPVPLIAEALLEPNPESAGLARRATDAIWRYFVAHGSLQDGALTQGYFRSDLRLLDSYSGPGSCQWGLRSLVLAFLARPDSDFWTAPEVPLPVEVADYRLALDRLGWIVEGDKATGDITIEIPTNDRSDGAVKSYGWRNKLYELVFQQPRRPGNHAAKYNRHSYSSAKPFWEG